MIKLIPRLIPDWRRAWRFLSVQAALLLAALSLVQAELLPLFRFAVPADKWPWVSAGFGTAIVLLRVVAQNLPPADPPVDAPEPRP